MLINYNLIYIIVLDICIIFSDIYKREDLVMWDAKIEELRDELNQKIESGISLSTEVLETSHKLDIAINEFYKRLEKEPGNMTIKLAKISL